MQFKYVLQLSHCAPSTAADAPTAAPLPFADFFASLQSQANQAVGDLNTKFLSLMNVTSNEQFVNSVAAQSNVFAEQIKTAVGQLQGQVEQDKTKIDGVVQGVQTRLSETVTSLKSKAPEDTQQVGQNIQTSLATVLKQAEQLNDKLKVQGIQAQSDLKNTIETLFQNTIETAKKLAVQADTAIKANKQ